MTEEDLIRQVDEYRESTRVNQSLLQQYINPEKSTGKDYSEHMGTLCDLRLYTPGRFARDYYVADEDTSVSEEVREILRTAAKVTNNAVLDIAGSYIVRIARDRAYMKNIKEDSKLLNNILVVKNGQKYYESLLKANGRIVIGNLDYAESTRIVNRFRSALAEMNYTYPGKMLYQFPVYFTHNGVECKGLLDFVIINDDEKTIKIVDTKVSDIGHGKYRRHATNLRYDFQLAFYYQGILWLIKNDPHFKGYKLLPPSLLVHSSVTETIVEYVLTEADLQIGQFGAETKSEWRIKGNSYGSSLMGMFYRKTEIFGFEDALVMYKESTEEGNPFIESLTASAYTVSTSGLWTS